MTYFPSDRPLPVIEVDHPMQMISPEAMEARAMQLVIAAEKLLDGESP
jgi:hypothetical protein